MKAPSLAVIAMLAAVSVAHAADLSNKPLYKAPVPIVSENWSGLYVGAGVGARFADPKWTTTAAFTPAGAPFPLSTDPNATFSNAAFRFSGYAGYNWQVSPIWVVGLEGDFGWANNRSTLASRIPGLGIVNGGSFSEVRGSWDASLRARAGYLVAPQWLAYATGGVAFQHLEAIATCPADPNNVCNPATGTQSFTSSSNRVGWTVGAGLETKLTQNWLARVEYRYSDFGSFSFVALPISATTFGANATLSTVTHMATLGLAYKFGGPY